MGDQTEGMQPPNPHIGMWQLAKMAIQLILVLVALGCLIWLCLQPDTLKMLEQVLNNCPYPPDQCGLWF